MVCLLFETWNIQGATDDLTASWSRQVWGFNQQRSKVRRCCWDPTQVKKMRQILFYLFSAWCCVPFVLTVRWRGFLWWSPQGVTINLISKCKRTCNLILLYTELNICVKNCSGFLLLPNCFDLRIFINLRHLIRSCICLKIVFCQKKIFVVYFIGTWTKLNGTLWTFRGS